MKKKPPYALQIQSKQEAELLYEAMRALEAANARFWTGDVKMLCWALQCKLNAARQMAH